MGTWCAAWLAALAALGFLPAAETATFRSDTLVVQRSASVVASQSTFSTVLMEEYVLGPNGTMTRTNFYTTPSTCRLLSSVIPPMHGKPRLSSDGSALGFACHNTSSTSFRQDNGNFMTYLLQSTGIINGPANINNPSISDFFSAIPGDYDYGLVTDYWFETTGRRSVAWWMGFTRGSYGWPQAVKIARGNSVTNTINYLAPPLVSGNNMITSSDSQLQEISTIFNGTWYTCINVYISTSPFTPEAHYITKASLPWVGFPTTLNTASATMIYAVLDLAVVSRGRTVGGLAIIDGNYIAVAHYDFSTITQQSQVSLFVVRKLAAFEPYSTPNTILVGSVNVGKVVIRDMLGRWECPYYVLYVLTPTQIIAIQANTMVIVSTYTLPGTNVPLSLSLPPRAAGLSPIWYPEVYFNGTVQTCSMPPPNVTVPSPSPSRTPAAASVASPSRSPSTSPSTSPLPWSGRIAAPSTGAVVVVPSAPVVPSPSPSPVPCSRADATLVAGNGSANASGADPTALTVTSVLSFTGRPEIGDFLQNSACSMLMAYVTAFQLSTHSGAASLLAVANATHIAIPVNSIWEITRSQLQQALVYPPISYLSPANVFSVIWQCMRWSLWPRPADGGTGASTVCSAAATHAAASVGAVQENQVPVRSVLAWIADLDRLLPTTTNSISAVMQASVVTSEATNVVGGSCASSIPGPQPASSEPNSTADLQAFMDLYLWSVHMRDGTPTVTDVGFGEVIRASTTTSISASGVRSGAATAVAVSSVCASFNAPTVDGTGLNTSSKRNTNVTGTRIWPDLTITTRQFGTVGGTGGTGGGTTDPPGAGESKSPVAAIVATLVVLLLVAAVVGYVCYLRVWRARVRAVRDEYKRLRVQADALALAERVKQRLAEDVRADADMALKADAPVPTSLSTIPNKEGSSSNMADKDPAIAKLEQSAAITVAVPPASRGKGARRVVLPPDASDVVSDCITVAAMYATQALSAQDTAGRTAFEGQRSAVAIRAKQAAHTAGGSAGDCKPDAKRQGSMRFSFVSPMVAAGKTNADVAPTDVTVDMNANNPLSQADVVALSSAMQAIASTIAVEVASATLTPAAFDIRHATKVGPNGTTDTIAVVNKAGPLANAATMSTAKPLLSRAERASIISLLAHQAGAAFMAAPQRMKLLLPQVSGIHRAVEFTMSAAEQALETAALSVTPVSDGASNHSNSLPATCCAGACMPFSSRVNPPTAAVVALCNELQTGSEPAWLNNDPVSIVTGAMSTNPSRATTKRADLDVATYNGGHMADEEAATSRSKSRAARPSVSASDSRVLFKATKSSRMRSV